MKLHQLSLFLENRPGAIKIPCRLLADAGINILTLNLADTAEYGILRLIVKDWQRARQVLTDAGSVVNVAEVIAIDVPHRPGGLADVLDVLDSENLGIAYMYAFARGRGSEHAAMIFRFDDPDRAVEVLSRHHIHAIASVDLFARVSA
jgi:hypothetical protein